MATKVYSKVLYGALTAALVTAGLAFYLLSRGNEKEDVAAQTVPVLVATKGIPEGTTIDRAVVGTVPWPVGSVPAGATAKLDSVVGRVTRVEIFPGDPIIESRLAPVGTSAGLAMKIEPGHRAMAVRINDVAGVAGLITPNSRVDVVVTLLDPTTQVQVSKLFMSNVRVLAMGTTLQQDPEGKPNPAPTVTLSVTPEEAERLASASSQGTIALVLRGVGHTDPIATQGATAVDVLSQLRAGQYAPRRSIAPLPAEQPPPSQALPRRPVSAGGASSSPSRPAKQPPESLAVRVFTGPASRVVKFDTAAKQTRIP